jgi:hypothetical protein
MWIRERAKPVCPLVFSCYQFAVARSHRGRAGPLPASPQSHRQSRRDPAASILFPARESSHPPVPPTSHPRSHRSHRASSAPKRQKPQQRLCRGTGAPDYIASRVGDARLLGNRLGNTYLIAARHLWLYAIPDRSRIKPCVEAQMRGVTFGSMAVLAKGLVDYE